MDRYDLIVARPGKDGKTHFVKIGAMFPSKDGEGFAIKLDALPLPDEKDQVWVRAMRPREAGEDRS